ncbi:Nucleic acid-binding- OB-fold-like protein [Striga hermonthica]|uniref:Nucleic acid-binding- OB-fold-like protein n=1 Tax=Striga hermonthica TaxID=68872 RepID=A0A9N7RCP5_STRHE|nr:Nucleic acid-binding- OB-fold-like protein [Striga hermonthica]
MASSISRKLSGAIFSKYRQNTSVSKLNSLPSCTRTLFSAENDSHSESDSELAPLTPDQSPPDQKPAVVERTLEDGLELGIYKAILVGQLGQAPIQKKLRSGKTVTLLSVGTGGIKNNRRPLDNEDPREYANRCNVQWHRVSIYPERLGDLASKNFVPGSILYVEGNLESKVFNDPITGLVRRIREVAVRRNGRVVFLGNGGGSEQTSRANVSGVGYY